MKAIKEFLKLKINWRRAVILAVVVFLLLAGFIYLQLFNGPRPRIISRIRADMEQMQTAAEIIYQKEGSYENVNCSYGDIKVICEDIEKNTGQKPTIHTSKDAYCAYSKLSKGFLERRTSFWCINSEGKSLLTAIYHLEDIYCSNGMIFECPRDR